MEALPRDLLPPCFVRSLGDAAFRVGRPIFDRQRIALSPDGSTLYVADYPSILELDAREGLVRRWLRDAPLLVGAMDFASDGTLCALHAQGLSWVDLARGEARDLVAFRPAYNVVLAPSPTDPRRAALVGTASFWDIEIVDGATGERVRCEPPRPEQAPRATAVAFSHDGATLFVAEGTHVHRVDARTGAHLGVLARLPSPSPHDGNLRGMVAVDEGALAVLGPRSTLWLIDARTGALLAERSWGDACWLSLLEGPDRDRRLVVARGGEARVLDPDTLADLHVIAGDFRLDHGGRVLLSRGSSRGFIADTRGALHPLDLAAGALTTTRPACFPSLLSWRGDALLVFRLNCAVEQIDLHGGTSRFVEPAFEGTALAFDPAGDRALVRAHDGAHGWLSMDDARFTPLSQEKHHRHAAIAGAEVWYVADRTSALVGGDRTIDLSPCRDPQVVVASPSGRRLFVALRAEAILVDLAGGAVLARYKILGAQRAAFVDEDEVVYAGPRGTRWIDARTGEVRDKSKHGAERAAFSLDGRRVLLMQGVASLTLIDRARPDDAAAWHGSSHPQCALFSRDGSRVFVAGAEAIVREYDVEAALASRPAPKAKRAKR